MKLRVTKPVVVEGRYDKARLTAVFDVQVIVTGGFRIYSDPQKRLMIQKYAADSGIAVLTDSDAAGFKLRRYIRSIVREGEIIDLFIPQIAGKERRKSQPSREGLLGVEGIDGDSLVRIFTQAGLVGDCGHATPANPITKADLYEAGLSGRPNSRQKRIQLLEELGLPNYLSVNELVEYMNNAEITMQN
ncbi:MAG: DUF4093 domain-containing protein [Oscillospiraceae bacterium]|nr:DUF4093 domain-containing protein [Oscillospiraceae bacterium]